jgi:uncharacterized protein (DUF1330 family)
MGVYLLAEIEIADREAYEQYQERTRGVLPKFGGEVLATEEAPVVLEGEWPATRTVLVRFADEEHALQWFHSDEYRAAVVHRRRGAKANLVLLKGLR